MKPLSVQLYSLRERSKEDFMAVLKDVADMGYIGVEPAGFYDIRPTEFRKVLDDLGLKMFSSHTPWCRINADGNNLGECMDYANLLGLDKIVCGYGADFFKDLDSIKRTADYINKAQEVLERNGFTLFQHNHYWEFERLDGRLKYEIYAELCPKVKFQMDCFWSTNKGREDAVEILKKFADRTILLHMKDGVCTQNAASNGMVNGLLDMKVDLLPLGTGTLPIADLVNKAMPDQVETIIVELDRCETDMTEAIAKSYRFMTENGLAAGRK